MVVFRDLSLKVAPRAVGDYWGIRGREIDLALSARWPRPPGNQLYFFRYAMEIGPPAIEQYLSDFRNRAASICLAESIAIAGIYGS